MATKTDRRALTAYVFFLFLDVARQPGGNTQQASKPTCIQAEESKGQIGHSKPCRCKFWAMSGVTPDAFHIMSRQQPSRAQLASPSYHLMVLESKDQEFQKASTFHENNNKNNNQFHFFCLSSSFVTYRLAVRVIAVQSDGVPHKVGGVLAQVVILCVSSRQIGSVCEENNQPILSGHLNTTDDGAQGTPGTPITGSLELAGSIMRGTRVTVRHVHQLQRLISALLSMDRVPSQPNMSHISTKQALGT
eukprot:1136797-Pelagomonas_calceolata.AAC.3